ncbi:MAG: flagellar hook-basal body complex protein FliE [Caulobacterales bacterium]
MNALEAINAVGMAVGAIVGDRADVAQPQTPMQTQSPGSGFSDMLARGVEAVENKIDAANEIVRDFAIDDTIPIHEVTIALEEARLAVELALQIRTRLVDGYREIMNMQL